MFFIGQSGYIITLLLTVFLPVFMLVTKPGQAIQQTVLADAGQVTGHIAVAHHSFVQELPDVMPFANIDPDFWDKLVIPFREKHGKIPVRPLSVVIAIPQCCKTNKAPPVG